MIVTSKRLRLGIVYLALVGLVFIGGASVRSGHAPWVEMKRTAATSQQAQYGSNPFGSGLYGGYGPPAAFTPALNVTSPTNNATPILTFATTDTTGIRDYEVKIDGGSFSTQTSPYQLPTLADGPHTITVRANNNSGQFLDRSVNVTVDTVAPNPFTPLLNVSSPTSNTTPVVTFSTTDVTTSVQRYEVKIDAGAYVIQTSPYAVPYLSDGPHTISIKAVDQAGNEQVGTVSVTVVSGGPSPFTPTLDVTSPTNNNQPVVTFSTTDPTTTIDHYELKLDGGAYATQASPYQLPVLSDGLHTVSVKAVNAVGNSTEGSVNVVVDTVGPVPFTPTLDVSSPTNNTTPVLSFATTDATTVVQRYEVKVDAQPFTVHTSPYTLPVLTDGPHVIVVRAFDGAGNTTDGTVNVTVDTAGPVAFAPTLNVTSPTANNTPTVTFATTDATSSITGYQVKVDAGSFTPQTSPYVLPALSDGPHTISVRATDAVGNTADGTINVTVDTTGPLAFTPTLNVSSPTNNTTPLLSFSTTDATTSVDNFQVKVDGGSFTTQTSSYLLPVLGNGAHTITVRATDAVGNTTDGTVNLTVDTVAPNAFTPTLDLTSPAPHRSPVLSFSTTDGGSGIGRYEVQIDNGPFSVRTSPYTLPPLADGTHDVRVRAFDAAGNSTDGTVSITVSSLDPNSFTPTFDVTSPSNVTTPVLSFSTTGPSPIDHYEVSIDNGAFTSQTSPLSVGPLADGTHTFTVRAIDSLANYTDATATMVTDTVSPDPFAPSANVLSPTQQTQPTIAFGTTDALAGIDRYELKVDAGSFAPATSGLQLPTLSEGVHTVTVRAFDRAGNFRDGTLSLTIDVAGPAPFTPTFSTSSPTTSSTVDVNFAATDPNGVDHYLISVDNTGFISAVSPVTLNNLTDGSHTVVVRAVDSAGNSTDGTASIVVDTTGPLAFAPDLNETSPTSNPAPTVTFSTTDATTSVAGYEVAVDAGSFTTQTSPYTLPALTDGSHTVKVRAIDVVGNATERSVNVVIDTVAPVAFTPGLNVSSPTGNATPTVTFSTTDATAGIDRYEVKVDSGGFATQLSPFTLPVLSDGLHAITVRAWDRAGNFTDGTVNVVVDTGGPTAFTPTLAPASPTNNTQPVLTFATSDNGTGLDHFEVSLDGGPFVTRTSPYTLPVMSSSSHVAIVRAVDGSGNNTDVAVPFIVDTVAPSAFTPTFDVGPVTTNNQPSVVFATTDALSGMSRYEVKVDGSSFSPQSSPYRLPVLADGSHTVVVRAFDMAGNFVDGSATTMVDKSAPAPFSPKADGNVTSDLRTFNKHVSLEFATTDGASGVDHYNVIIDSVPHMAASSPYVTPELSNGPHVIVIQAYDAAGNHRDEMMKVGVGPVQQGPSQSNGGYRLVGKKGGIYSYGDAPFFGSASELHLDFDVVGIAAMPSNEGYWLVSSDGGVYSYGKAWFWGSMAGHNLNKPIVGMTSTPSGLGYWLIASDGGIFSFGDAQFYGSMGGQPLNKPMVGMMRTFDGNGYWLVASDGGIFSFGDAQFYGSGIDTGRTSRVVGMSPTFSGRGYLLARANGQVDAFGDAQAFGEAVGEDIAGIAPTADGQGYWLIGRDGGVFALGNARYVGSANAIPSRETVVAVG